MNLKLRLCNYCYIILFLYLYLPGLLAGPWLEVRDDDNQLLIREKKISLYTNEIRTFRFLMHGDNFKNNSDYQVSLGVKYRTSLPEYAFGFRDQYEIVQSGDTLTLKDTLYIHPEKTGIDTITIWGSVRYGLNPTDGLEAGQFKLYIYVLENPFKMPKIYQEPEFTQGLSNTVVWEEARNAFYQEAYFFDTKEPTVFHRAVTGLFKSSGGNIRQTPFENLATGETYGYFIKSVQQTYNGERYFYTDFEYSTQDNAPPEPVNDLQAIQRFENRIELSWHSVDDAISGIAQYRIYRILENGPPVLLDSIDAMPGVSEVLNWDDMGFPLSTFYYIIHAVDQVGNEGVGIPSNIFSLGDQNTPIVLNPDSPIEISSNENIHFIITTIDTLYCTLDGREDSIRFQTVRDSVDFFEQVPELPFRYFDSGWLKPSTLPTDPMDANRVYWVVDFSDSNRVYEHFINGHTYIKRYISDYGVTRDTFGLGQVTVDLFPPGDIANLDLRNLIDDYQVPLPTDGYSRWHSEVTWAQSSDFVSGLHSYQIYRQIVGIDASYFQIESALTKTSFTDTLSLIGSIVTNPIVRYRIGSVDSMGHKRGWQETAWEVEGRALDAPVPVFNHLNDPDNFRLLPPDTLFTKMNQIQLKLTNFDMTDVQHFIVAINGQEFVHQVSGDNTIHIDLPDQELTQIMIRAIYYGGRSSIWSKYRWVIQSLPWAPKNLSVWNDSLSWDGHIYLSWERPTYDVDYYEVWRYTGQDSLLAGEVETGRETISWTDQYDVNELNGETEIPLTTYQVYGYKVRKISLFDEPGQMTPLMSIFCNRPPRIRRHSVPVFDDGNYVFSIYWQRSKPNLVQAGFNTRIQVYEDSLTITSLLEDIVITDSDTNYAFRSARADHNYIFRIQEQPHQQGLRNSAWSRPFTVSSLVKLEPFTVLPQPRGHIYVDWDAPDMIESLKIDSFVVCRDSTCWSFPVSTRHMMDPFQELTYQKAYTYQVYALDSLNQVVASNAKTGISDTGAVFIPDIQIFPMRYFNSDSVLVSWVWRDINGNPLLNDTRGAVSYLLQASVSHDFPDDEIQTETSGPHSLQTIENQRTICIPLLGNEENEKVYFRISCMDNWGHPISQLWSTDFYPHRTLIYDPIPPNIPDDINFLSQQSYYHGPDSVVLSMQWTAEGVEYLPEGSTQFWNRLIQNVYQYKLFIKPFDVTEHVRTLTATATAMPYMVTDTVQNLQARWQIVITDSALNTNETAWFTAPYYLPSPMEPTPRNHRSCHITPLENDTLAADYFVELALQPAHFQYGYEIDHGSQIDQFICQSDWLSSLSFSCSSGWGRVEVDTTWFRSKARKWFNGQFWESGWSELAIYTGKNDGYFEENQFLTNDLPETFDLMPNYPNPFNPNTTIQYSLPEACQVRINIYDIRGQFVKTLVNENQEPGLYQMEWTSSNSYGLPVSTGIYLVHIIAITEQQTRFEEHMKMMLIK